MNPFNLDTEVVLSAAGARRIRRGHPWIYDGDLLREAGDPTAPIVKVLDPANNVLGYALHSRHSRIRLRYLSRETEPPCPEMLRARIQASIRRRGSLLAANSGCRLVFGEADLLPSIIIDKYAGALVLQTLSAGAEALKSTLIEILAEQLEPAGILERNDVKSRLLEGLDERRSVLWGQPPENVEISEGGIGFLIDLIGGQKTGFYLDQRENRMAARSYAFGRALDCFTNTGGFALHFALSCHSVTAIDVSTDALEQGRRNAALNRIVKVIFREANVFDYLREQERSGEKYDTICLDPPAFARSRDSLRGARGGYKEINLRAMKLLNPEGILVTSSCSYHLSEADFAQLLHEAARDAHRHVQILERRSQGSDHPMLAGVPETHYLKCFILRIL